MKSQSGQNEKISSVIALEKLLIDINTNPNNYTHDLEMRERLSSQGRLSALKYDFSDGNTNHSIEAMSLNSLKTYSTLLFEAGFQRINELRISAIQALSNCDTQSKQPSKRSKNALYLKVTDLEVQLDIQRKTNLTLLQAIQSAVSAINITNKTVDTQLRDKRAKDAINEIQNIMKLGAVDFSQRENVRSIVTNLDDFRREK